MPNTLMAIVDSIGLSDRAFESLGGAYRKIALMCLTLSNSVRYMRAQATQPTIQKY